MLLAAVVADGEALLGLEWLAEGETLGEVAEADGLVLADVLRETSVIEVVAAGEMEIVDAATLAGALEPEPTTEAPADESLLSPVWAPPKSMNATTAMPAKPPVSMSPMPRSLCESRSARGLLRDPPPPDALGAADSDADADLAAAFGAGLDAALDADLGAGLDADLGAVLACAASGAVLACAASGAVLACAASGAVLACAASVLAVSFACDGPGGSSEVGTKLPSAGAGLPGSSFSTRGIRTVERTSCIFVSSSPVAPQPAQDTAPLRCLRHVLQ